MKTPILVQRIVQGVSGGLHLETKLTSSIKSIVWEDDSGALALEKLEPPRITPRSKHYAIKYHWFREKLDELKIVMKYVDTQRQKADILTKGLPYKEFCTKRELIMGW